MESTTIFADISRLVSTPNKLMAGAVHDEEGVTWLFYPEGIALQGEDLKFTLPSSHPALRHLQRFPEGSVSIVDTSSFTTPTPLGLQIKGLAELSGGKVRLSTEAVYDVIPRGDLDLKLPLYERKKGWWKTVWFKSYTFKSIPFTLSPEIHQTVSAYIENLHQKLWTPSYVGTTDPDIGVPNLSPRWIVQVSREYWLFGSSKHHKTSRNILKPAPTSVLLYHPTLAEGYLAVGWTNLSEDPRDKEVTESFWNQKGFTVKALQAFRYFPMELYRITRDAIEPLGSFPSRKEWLHTS
jgi:hypothetical protein